MIENDPEIRKTLQAQAIGLTDIILTRRQLHDYEFIVSGVYAPLSGFMCGAEHAGVLSSMRLSDGTVWPLPIVLDIDRKTADRLPVGQSVAIRDQEGFLLALMRVDDMFPVEPEKECGFIFGTADPAHAGVKAFYDNARDYYIGGVLTPLNLPIHFDFKHFRHSPDALKSMYGKLGWQRVVAFITRNPIHRPQFDMTVSAMQEARAGLLVLPVTGICRPGDFDHHIRIRCYQRVERHYPPGAMVVNLLPYTFRMAGPREALLHVCMVKNLGCTHIIMGNDHAGPDARIQGKAFYEAGEAVNLARRFGPELGVSVIAFDEMVYLPFEDRFASKNAVSDREQPVLLEGADFRKRIREGRHIPEWFSFPEVIDELRKAYPPPSKQGFTLFLTGLSGAGKSTIAKILYSQLLEIGARPVTLLDGDIVRIHLSSELTFSKPHRDINVGRIGFVASEITKNRGIAICAPIAPYAGVRDAVRDAIEVHGGFVEIHVATPLSVCEQRDRKGMYAKARKGLIKDFTGVDDPYEIPVAPEIRIDTTAITPEEAAQEIMLYLSRKGFI